MGSAAIFAAVGDRIYPIQAGDGTQYPYLTYQRVSGPRGATHDGADSLVRARYSWTATAPTHAVARRLADLVKARLLGFKGFWSGVEIGGVLPTETDVDDFEPTPPEYKTTVDVIVQYQEVVA